MSDIRKSVTLKNSQHKREQSNIRIGANSKREMKQNNQNDNINNDNSMKTVPSRQPPCPPNQSLTKSQDMVREEPPPMPSVDDLLNSLDVVDYNDVDETKVQSNQQFIEQRPEPKTPPSHPLSASQTKPIKQKPALPPRKPKAGIKVEQKVDQKVDEDSTIGLIPPPVPPRNNRRKLNGSK